MYHYFNTLTNTNGDSLVGYLVRLTNQDGAVQTLYADENYTPIASVSGVENAAVTDEEGNYDFFVENGTYNLEFLNSESDLLKAIRWVPMNGDVSPEMTQILVETEEVRDQAEVFRNEAGGFADQAALDRAATEAARDEAEQSAGIAQGATLTKQFYPGARSYVPQGLKSVAITAAGTGGTNGDYVAPLSGDNLSVDAFVNVTVSGGAVTAVSVNASGLYIGNAMTIGTVDLSGIAGLTGATVTPTGGYLVNSGEYYYTDHATDSEKASRFQNQSNVAVEIDASVDYLDIGLARDWASKETGEPDPVNHPGKLSAYQYAEEARDSASAISTNYPLSHDGTLIMEFGDDASGVSRVVRGIDIWTGEPVYPGLALLPDVSGLARAFSDYYGAAPLAMNGEVPLAVFGNTLRAVTINPETGLITPAQGGVAPVEYDTLLPNDARLAVSDYYAISERSAERLRFIRDGIVDSNNYQHCSPGSRVRFWTTAAAVEFDVFWNNLVTRDDVENMVAAVMVDGVVSDTFASDVAPNETGSQTFTVELGSSGLRLVELIWPYGTGMDLTAVRVSRGAGVSLPADRPARRLIVIGDSIRQGFNTSSIVTSTDFQIAQDNDYSLLNMGFGSGLANVSDADFLDDIDTPTADDVIVVAFGYNHFAQQQALATFESTLEGLFAAIRAKAPATPVIVQSMIYTPNTNTITPAQYRTATQDAFDDWADGNSTFVDGLAVMTNNANRLNDNIHPNDLGAGEIAAAYPTYLPS